MTWTRISRQPPATHSGAQSAFTIVEMSVVLVIIGLIVGGIVVGRELLTASQIRSELAQLDAFALAARTFKVKYGYLPGDMPAAEAAALGLPNCNGNNCASGTGNAPNANGIIDMPDGSARICQNETKYFFPQLSGALLVAGKFSVPSGSLTIVGTTMPAMRLDGSSGVLPISHGSRFGDTNYFLLGVQAASTSLEWVSQHSTRAVLSPDMAYGLDSKMDDGIPSTGNIRAVKWTWTGSDFDLDHDTSASQCVKTAAATDYNVTSKTVACRLMFKLQ